MKEYLEPKAEIIVFNNEVITSSQNAGPIGDNPF